MRSIWFSRAARAFVALALLSATAATVVAAKPGPERPGRRRAVNLFAVTNAVLNVNRVFCGINNLGELCVDPTNSPVVGGGFWPKGSPDQYIFNSGLQLAGVIPSTAGGGKPTFPWAGDTVGAFFFDARGTQVQGDAVTLVYNSLDPADAAAWPNGAKVRDPALYNSVLINPPRDNISQQDLWTRAWDGNPAFLSGRTHPAGILVEERGLAWNFPTGNEDIIYFLFTFYNVTARNCAVYAGLDPAIQAEICAVGQNFQNRNEAVFNFPIPDDGYPIGSLYTAFSMDPDVGDAGRNYSTAILPFNMGVAYKADFLEPNWAFPPEIFGPPFVSSPGFVGVKYLLSPKVGGTEVGLTMFSNTRNASTGFPDPVGVLQLYRYLSGTVSPAKGDNPCTVAKPIESHLCFLDQTAADTRFYQSSGPFTLAPGESQTIVVAYVHAAPLPDVVPFIGGDMKPNIPANGAEIFADPAQTIRSLERAAGWAGQNDANANDTISQDEVQTVPRSLLDKALVAQAVFNNKFLLPFAPEPPKFFLIPGDNEVSVVWQKSATEATGDPFYAVASAPLNPDGTANPLYDPNFNHFDVEGYRIYRGRTTGQLELVAQVDYSGTSLIDYTGNFAYTTDVGSPGDPNDGGTPDGVVACAPELGVQDDCPEPFPSAGGVEHDLSGNIIQVPVGGRVLLANGNVLIVNADTAVTGGHTGFSPLTNSGISFAFTDNGVRNAFTYFYAVTAFDVNSLKSGPSSLESPRITKSTTPRAASGQETAGSLGSVSLIDKNDATLDPSAPVPTINADSGTFSGPMPPTNGLQLGFGVFPSQLLSGGTITLTIDSIVPGATLTGARPAIYYMRGQGATGGSSVALPLQLDAFSGSASNFTDFPADAYIQSKTTRFGGDSTFSIYGRVTLDAPGGYRLASWGRGDINGDPANSAQAGPRWWAGTGNENVRRPNELVCTPADGACVQGDLTRNAGQLPGVSVLFHFQSYSTVQNAPPRDLEGIGATVARAADFRVYWGTTPGTIDSVMDLTHHVRVPFSTKMRASWGILNAASFAGTNQATTPDNNNNLLTWTDDFCVDPSPSYINRCGGAAQTPAVLQNTAALNQVAAVSSAFATPPATATGTGFTFYLNGHFFLMQTATLPASPTVWNARFFAGSITGTGGSYAFRSSIRPPAVPGLRAKVTYTGSSGLVANVTADSLLQRIHTVPDPYYVTNSLEITPTTKVLKFVNLPAQAILRIYSVSGVLVQVLNHNDATGGGDLTWNLRNRNNQFVASGVYFYHVETPDGKKKIGRFTVINFAQ